MDFNDIFKKAGIEYDIKVEKTDKLTITLKSNTYTGSLRQILKKAVMCTGFEAHEFELIKDKSPWLEEE